MTDSPHNRDFPDDQPAGNNAGGRSGHATESFSQQGPQNQAAELARVKARIRALAERTISNGCTEAEALAAAAMVGRLLERYALSMDEVEVRQSRCVELDVPLKGQKRRPIDGCVPGIARFCDCKVWLARDEGQPRYVFFGFETDALLARYLYDVIDRAIEHEVLAFRAIRPRRTGLALRQATTGFQHGMATRIAERLEEMALARAAHTAAHHPSGTALVVVKEQVVEEAFRATGTRLVSGGRQRAVRHDPAFRQGHAAGDKVNLNRPVGQQPRRPLR